MAQSLVVSGLAAKRAELTGQIQHHRAQIATLTADVAHLDATIKLFDPAMDVSGIAPKARRQRNSYFRPGEGPRAVLDALRTAGQALTTREITERVVADRGIEPTLIDAVQKSVSMILSKLLAKKLVRIVATDRNGMRSWQIA